MLSLGGVIELAARWIFADGGGVTVGSFHVTRRAFLNPRLSDIALLSLGAIQLFVEFAIGVRALLLAHHIGLGRESGKIGPARGCARWTSGDLCVLRIHALTGSAAGMVGLYRAAA